MIYKVIFNVIGIVFMSTILIGTCKLAKGKSHYVDKDIYIPVGILVTIFACASFLIASYVFE